MTKIFESVWADALAEIQRDVSPERFSLWFRSTELIEQEGPVCSVGVPNAFVGQWLQEHFGDVVRGALGRVTGSEVTVRFVVSPLLFKESREEELRQKQELVEELDSSLGGTPAAARPAEREYRLEDFVVGPSNRLAYAAVLHVVRNRDRSLNPLVIHGSVGLGKTHLLKGMMREWGEVAPNRALYLSAESFTNQFLVSLQHNSLDGFRRKFRDIDVLILDDLQFLAGKPATQDEFLQTYNFLMNLNKQVVLASDGHPREMDKLRETLMTRLVSGMIVRLDTPEFETRLAILRKKLDGRSALVDNDVLAFIAENVRGSIRELEGAATTLIATAALAGEKIDLTMARRAVASLLPSRAAQVTAADIEKAVARMYRVTVDDIHSTRRHKSIALPRHVAMYLARELTSLSWKEISRHFGRHNHTGALFAHQKIAEAVKRDEMLADCIRRLRAELGA